MSSSFGGFVVGFRVKANVGGDFRYKSCESLLEPWQKGKHGLPTLEKEGSMLEIILDQEAGTVTFRAPELCKPHIGAIQIKEEDRGLPLHLYVNSIR